jgi:hypothetical protein
MVLSPEIIEMPNTGASITTVHHVICTITAEYYKTQYIALIQTSRAQHNLATIITNDVTTILDVCGHYVHLATDVQSWIRAIHGSEVAQEMSHGTITRIRGTNVQVPLHYIFHTFGQSISVTLKLDMKHVTNVKNHACQQSVVNH